MSKWRRIQISFYRILSNNDALVEIRKLLLIFALIETSVIDNERIHSLRKFIESERRQHLTVANVDAILRLKCNHQFDNGFLSCFFKNFFCLIK